MLVSSDHFNIITFLRMPRFPDRRFLQAINHTVPPRSVSLHLPTLHSVQSSHLQLITQHLTAICQKTLHQSICQRHYDPLSLLTVALSDTVSLSLCHGTRSCCPVIGELDPCSGGTGFDSQIYDCLSRYRLFVSLEVLLEKCKNCRLKQGISTARTVG